MIKDMLPKTEIRFSFVYNKQFSPSISFQEFTNLKKESRPFIDIFQKNIKEVLKLIESHNEPWERDHIPIYIISAKIKSFSDPLTLNYKKNHKLLLLILIHELIHNNITKKYKDTIELHKEIDKIYQRVLSDLNLKGFEETKEEYNEKYKGF